ncbi:MAG TPA: N,N-dimethylformamidase beta subunit family domain-containing protein [Gaiellaceae bacterium]|nr:N,N-dimethylformamidase beta subunit family domain-containing protein [Gaiellaceae bacterium]
MRTPRLVAAGLCVVAFLVAPVTLRAAPPMLAIVGAAPHSDLTDTPWHDYLRVTFSPDGNGLNDRVRVRAIAKAGTQLELDARPESSAKRFVVDRKTAVGGTTTLTWDGRLANGHVAPDASFILDACIAGTTQCAQWQVMAHVRVLDAYVPADVGVQPGQTLPVVIQTDRPGPFTIDLRPAVNPLGPGVGAVTVPAAGTVRYTIPKVDGGLWIVHVASGPVYAQYPLVVHSDKAMTAPGRGTALVVFPYLTWRAYNDADANRDGQVDSWYAHPLDPVVPLLGPFETYRQEAARNGREADPQDQQAFAAWHKAHPASTQFVTDIELGRLSLDTLRKYALIVFPGHSEYYEQTTYDNLMAYRNGGGHLYFMSGNPFYGQVKVGPSTITRLTYRFRTQTQSDFSIATTGFVTCCWPRTMSVRYHVTAAALKALPWLFAGTGVGAGAEFGRAQGEVDTIDPKLSPATTVVAATATVPPFESNSESYGWIGTVPFSYPHASNHAVTLDAAYAATAKGEVFSWGNEGFSTGLYDPALPDTERDALARAAWNVWLHFAR